jgi:PD-(D/E)XK endonuclease
LRKRNRTLTDKLGDKRRGELAELAFTHKAASLGFGVARPFGESHPYDLLLQHGRRLLRIQVKSCFTTYRRRNLRGFAIVVCRHSYRGNVHYSSDDIDFIAAYVAPHDAWYIIPVEAVAHLLSIRLYPDGKSKRAGAFFEIYREAWHLLLDQAEKGSERYTSKELKQKSSFPEARDEIS